MTRRVRKLVLAATVGLLLVAPATTALATPMRLQSFQSVNVPLSGQTLGFRDAKAEQLTRYDAGRESDWSVGFVILDAGSRYDGKRVPI